MAPIDHIHILLNYQGGPEMFRQDILERAGYQQNGTPYSCEDIRKRVILRLADHKAKKEDIPMNLLGLKGSLESKYNIYMTMMVHNGSLSEREIRFHYQLIREFLNIYNVPHKCMNPPQEERKDPHRMKVLTEGGLERELLASE